MRFMLKLISGFLHLSNVSDVILVIIVSGRDWGTHAIDYFKDALVYFFLKDTNLLGVVCHTGIVK
jgi:hypothetical protein